MFCPECGARNAEGARFCMNCGHTLPTTPTHPAMPVQTHTPGPAHQERARPTGGRGFPVKALLIGLSAAVAVAIVVTVVVLVLRSQGEETVMTVVASPTPAPIYVTVVVTSPPAAETGEPAPAIGAPTAVLPTATSTPVSPTATPTQIPITATFSPIPPTQTSGPQVIPASQESITVDGFQCSVLKIAYDDAIFGTVPATMGPSEKILFVEFALITGENEAFADLRPVIVLESGTREDPAAWIGNKNVHVLTTVTYTGASSKFSPADTSIALAYVVPQYPGTALLEFPSGVSIDLTPLMP